MANLCACGCGLSARNKFVSGHNKLGSHNPNWHGGITEGVYRSIRLPDHPRANSYGYVMEHIVVAESALGRFLPPGVEIHHVNEHKKENIGKNLVICQDRNYHQLLHVRARAFKLTGNVNARKCWICKQWDMDVHSPGNGKGGYHKTCQSEYDKQRNNKELTS